MLPPLAWMTGTAIFWYSPSNAERYSPEEFQAWAHKLRLKIDFSRSEEACHTMIVSRQPNEVELTRSGVDPF